MAKILEALRFPERNEETPVARPFEPASAEESDPPAGGEIPFIEVGGPNKTVEGSPSVLAASPRRSENKPIVTDQPVQLVTPLAETKYAGVVFCPLPADPATLLPAYERFAPEMVAFHRPEHPVSEQYRTLLAGIEAQLPNTQSRVLLFTAAAARAGTTTVVLNLGITSARRGIFRVVIIDANLIRPAVADRLGLPHVPGLCDVLAGTMSPQRALFESGEEHLFVLTCGNTHNGARLGGEAMRNLLRQLRSQFDLVLIDAPAWDGRPDVISLATSCDAVYLVTPRDKDPEFQELLNNIATLGCHVRGSIVAQPVSH